MSDNETNDGCFRRFINILALAMVLGLGAAAYYIASPQDLSDIEGATPSLVRPSSPPRDMRAVLTKSIEGKYSLQISEADLNQWLTRELKLHQAGALAEWVTLKRVCVRLRQGIAEVIIERDILGYSLTTSMFLQVEQTESAAGISTQIHLHGGGFHEMAPNPTRGGRFGQLTIPQGFLMLVMPDFQKIAQLFETEIDLGFQRMARIKIEDKRLVLDPNQPTRADNDREETF